MDKDNKTESLQNLQDKVEKQQSDVPRSQSYGFGFAVRDQTKVRRELPEQRTFSKSTVTIIGDSMLRGVKRNDLNIAAPAP